MPFDNPNGIDVSVQNVEEIALLDKVLEIIPTYRQWCKGHLTTPSGRHCLIGALMTADGWDGYNRGWPADRSEAYQNVQKRLCRMVKNHPEAFNDRWNTKYQDVRRLVLTARASFE